MNHAMQALAVLPWPRAKPDNVFQTIFGRCLMHGIHHGVKSGNMALAQTSFTQTASALARRHGLSTLVLGCTEIPLALRCVLGLDALSLVGPAVLLVKALAQRVYQL